MNSLTPTLYLPIEEANRELNGKILVGISAIQRGITVVIGQQWLLASNHEHMPRGIVLFKGMNARQTNAMQHLKASGHEIVANDEEAMGLADEDYIARDIAAEIHQYCDLYLAQGAFHAKIIEDRTGAPPDQIAIVGNPRLDLLREPFRSSYVQDGARFRAKYGEYVLFNTNHGCFNTAWGSREAYLDVQVRIGWIDKSKAEDMALFERHIIDDEANFQVNLEAIRYLRAARPDTTVIVRPHQAERLETWSEIFRDDPKTYVLREGSHLGWMLGASIMLNTGCTTGLEAAIVQSPVLNILPEGGKALLQDSFLSNSVNQTTVGAKQAAEIARDVLNGESHALTDGAAKRAAILRNHFAGIEGTFAHEYFAEAMSTHLDRQSVDRSGFRWRPTAPDRLFTRMNRTDYQKEKVSLTLEEFRAIWDHLAALMGGGIDVEVREIGESVFVVERA
jgi:surface carbohydrate biosynthesis protein